MILTLINCHHVLTKDDRFDETLENKKEKKITNIKILLDLINYKFALKKKKDRFEHIVGKKKPQLNSVIECSVILQKNPKPSFS